MQAYSTRTCDNFFSHSYTVRTIFLSLSDTCSLFFFSCHSRVRSTVPVRVQYMSLHVSSTCWFLSFRMSLLLHSNIPISCLPCMHLRGAESPLVQACFPLALYLYLHSTVQYTGAILCFAAADAISSMCTFQTKQYSYRSLCSYNKRTDRWTVETVMCAPPAARHKTKHLLPSSSLAVLS